ncbi:unnamed protein product (macronuclear) [Paramecium tetraurelia]|uniref:Uncharacterized protein n=1 Tax=Paramecium tetraurelia TaxID=5888 RepID=A0DCQ4_PARTE|nr:uncharacterized protein GSPATT00039412001 [Paramecium tetraurelia]CAK80821.1 unnamed protein product [Paramecium tetraurelia]|eukprot:XP_001448218.1 hypothetical protein (macronuclear) [Paramecium tetraurelia strain d4-2]
MSLLITTELTSNYAIQNSSYNRNYKQYKCKEAFNCVKKLIHQEKNGYGDNALCAVEQKHQHAIVTTQMYLKKLDTANLLVIQIFGSLFEAETRRISILLAFVNSLHILQESQHDVQVWQLCSVQNQMQKLLHENDQQFCMCIICKIQQQFILYTFQYFKIRKRQFQRKEDNRYY